MDKDNTYIAHVRENDHEIQELSDHLRETAELCSKFSAPFGFATTGFFLGMIHDIGKSIQRFKNYILAIFGLLPEALSDYAASFELKGKIDHGGAGAYYAYTNKKLGIMARAVLGLLVRSHHGGLRNGLNSTGKNDLAKAMARIKESEEVWEAFNKSKDILNCFDDQVFTEIKTEFQDFSYRLQQTLSDKQITVFMEGLMIKMLYSCLIDADRTSTVRFEEQGQSAFRQDGNYVSWERLIQVFETHLSTFDEQSLLNKNRQLISHRCFQQAKLPRDVYRLTVPTGGGKTLSSLRFALHHARWHSDNNEETSVKRIFYILPLTTIIDQNADVVRSIFHAPDLAGRVVLEHHSNLLKETFSDENDIDGEIGYRHNDLLSENWDAPIIFITLARFLECFFDTGTRDVRRMHQLADSILIFDEIQNMDIHFFGIFNSIIRFLKEFCNCTIILCTATQPLFDSSGLGKHALPFGSQEDLLEELAYLDREFKRVEIIDITWNAKGSWKMTEEELVSFVQTLLKTENSVLIVTNTKKQAANLYRRLKKMENNSYHLSTNMCPCHRKKQLENIIEALDRIHNGSPEKLICVSTNLIEAGCDLDFDTGIRYKAGMDSVIQTAGRINRNARQAVLGKLYIVELADENLGSSLKTIEFGKKAATRVLDDFRSHPEFFSNDLQSRKTISLYYQYYYELTWQQNEDLILYPRKKDGGGERTIYGMVSDNQSAQEEYGKHCQRIHKTIPPIPVPQAFKDAAMEFQAIDDSGQQGVLVQYEEGEALINQLCGNTDLATVKAALKEGQKYSVNLSSSMFEKLQYQNAIHETQKGSGIVYLLKDFYDMEIGVVMERGVMEYCSH